MVVAPPMVVLEVSALDVVVAPPTVVLEVSGFAVAAFA